MQAYVVFTQTQTILNEMMWTVENTIRMKIWLSQLWLQVQPEKRFNKEG